MTKTNYEKELEREIEEGYNLKKDEKFGILQSEYRRDKAKAKLEGYKKAKQEERERILEIGDEKFIGDLYADDNVDTENYDIIVKIWEELKKELGK